MAKSTDPSEAAILTEIRDLRRAQRDIAFRLRQLCGMIELSRDPLHCLRCGWDWVPQDPTRMPYACPQCGSAGWNRPPTPNSRKPSDPPSPSWRPRKDRRRKWERNPYLDPPGPPYIPPVPAAPPTVEEQFMVPATRDRLETIKYDTPTTVAPAPVVTIVPPSVRAAIPPPPAPRPVASLSEQFRVITLPQAEEQPERMASHVPDVEAEVMPSDRGLQVHTSEDWSAPAGDHAEPATVTSVDQDEHEMVMDYLKDQADELEREPTQPDEEPPPDAE